MRGFAESTVEDAALAWLQGQGYSLLHGPEIAPGEPDSERASYGDVFLMDRLRSAIARINPKLPADAVDEVVRKVTRNETPRLVENNRRFHRLIIDGVDVSYPTKAGLTHDKAWLVDFERPDRNEFLAVNQLTVTEGKANRRPDIVLFVNGLPVAVIELKNAADENATIRGAFNQLQTYKKDIPSLFTANALLLISDGLAARVGTLSADWERFMPWRTIEGKEIAPKGSAELEVLLKGIFAKERLLDLIRHFVVFEDDGKNVTKKLAGYHQFHAVNKAVECAVKASSPQGDKRVGVIWHTQGSGKSLTMAFFAGKIIRLPALANPTLVVLTDRNDLDDQLFGTFSLCQELLRQKPVQAGDRGHLRELLKVASGGVIFTTIQKFVPENKGDKFPELSDRRNIVVIADEAHRSQYDFIDGFARHLHDALPKASFIGFTGTPIESGDKSTPAVFGDYIDIYDIQRAVEDGATVRIYYEGRLAKIELLAEERPKIDPEFEELTEGQETSLKEKMKTKWARLEAMVGTEKRINLIAADIVDHWEARLESLDGKAMIVCMSRRICLELYKAIIKLRPAWHSDDDDKGVVKVVMTGSADDPMDWQPHIRNKAKREALAKRYKKPEDELKLVIVRDMWLTGFDAPCMHTMYVDKPMRGHGLMQAIARVNRVFRDKPGGLVVDYLGLADQLRKALADYTEGDRGEAGIPQEEAVEVLREKYEVVSSFFHEFDYSRFFTAPATDRLTFLPLAMEHVIAQEDGDERYLKTVLELSKAFALAVPHEYAISIRDEVGFFQAVRAGIAKLAITSGEAETQEGIEAAVRQMVSRAVASDEVIDIFAAAGLQKPEISILSDEFLAEVKGLPQKNVALETLRKLLNDEIKMRARTNLVQSRSFAEMLEKTIRLYQNRSIETAEVITRLIDLAKDMRQAQRRGDDLGLSDDEVAFYDALETNDSAVKVLGDDTLRLIARELVDMVKRNTSIDWTLKESAKAKLRVLVKRILKKHGYPPDKQEKATQTVLQQAELLCRDWAA